MNVQTWLVRWFDSHAAVEKDEVLNRLNENYFQLGWIDSLGLITLISEIEGNFGIKFLNEEFQDRRFSTIAGLSELIEGKLTHD